MKKLTKKEQRLENFLDRIYDYTELNIKISTDSKADYGTDELYPNKSLNWVLKKLLKERKRLAMEYCAKTEITEEYELRIMSEIERINENLKNILEIY
jgi:hypothetical protein